jgi:hypothetical protein
MTLPIYKELTTVIAGTTSTIIQRTDPDGLIWFIPLDESNTDYQAYLNKDNPKDEPNV